MRVHHMRSLETYTYSNRRTTHADWPWWHECRTLLAREHLTRPSRSAGLRGLYVKLSSAISHKLFGRREAVSFTVASAPERSSKIVIPRDVADLVNLANESANNAEPRMEPPRPPPLLIDHVAASPGHSPTCAKSCCMQRGPWRPRDSGGRAGPADCRA